MASQSLYPRPEYPRPDFQRGSLEGQDWINLNGPWQFRFDPANGGREENWFSPDLPEWREQIIVPFCWESLAAWGEADAAGNDNYYSTRVFRNPLEVTRANHRSAARYEIGWYRRWIEVPADGPWERKRVVLHIGAADFFTDCWCNGVHLGHHEGGYTPFEYDLTDHLSPGPDGKRRALLVLRVEDPMDNAEQPVGKQWRWYTTTSGIWQTVFLEPRDPLWIRSFRFHTDIDQGTVKLHVQCVGTAEGRVEAEIRDPSGGTQTVSFDLAGGEGGGTVKLDRLFLWDPNAPHLYSVLLQLRSGQRVADTVRSYFGMRKVDFEASASGVPAGLRLNGVLRYLRGALYQSYYPEGVYTASSVETLRQDILQAKGFGFNFLRVHIKIDDPLLLYYADQLGMLLMADFPNFGEGGDTPLGRRRFEVMMREAIERDFNHPSIFAWCLFNETWGFGGQTELIEHLYGPPKGVPSAAAPPANRAAKPKRPAAGDRPGMMPPQEWVQDMWEVAKSLDSTRLVEDMSVCHWDHLEYYLHCDTDINSWHFYISEYPKAREHIEKIVRSTFVGSSFNYVPGFLHKGQPLINSEYGGVGALDGDRDVSWSFKFLTNELRRYQQIAAYIYTELHDVEWEYNGFLNYDRTPKEFGYDPRIINESNTLPIDAPPVQRLPPGSSVQIPVASSHFSTRPLTDVTLFWSLGGIDTRGQFHQDLGRGRVPIPFPHRRVAPAHTIDLRLPDVTMLCTLVVGAQTPSGQTVAQNFIQFLAAGDYPPAREEIPRGLVLRGTVHDWAEAAWSGPCIDRDKARAEDCFSAFGDGFIEWRLPLDRDALARAHRLRVLCEASSHRSDSPQTDDDVLPTTLHLYLNDILLYNAVLRDHPHDARGVLSYWRGGLGAYGFLVHAFADTGVISRIAANSSDNFLRLRCAVPSDAPARGGLTLYGAECGRYPVGPTVIIEWKD